MCFKKLTFNIHYLITYYKLIISYGISNGPVCNNAGSVVEYKNTVLRELSLNPCKESEFREGKHCNKSIAWWHGIFLYPPG